MAIKRNYSSVTDASVTIVRTKVGDTDGRIPNTDYIVRSYARFNNASYTFMSVSSIDDMLIILCEIPSSASGKIMGVSGMYVEKSGSNLVYHIGSVTHTIAWQSGKHLIGFVNKKCYFDGVLTHAVPSGSASGAYRIGGILNGSDIECISQIDIYRAVVNCKTLTDSKERVDFYPVTNLSGTFQGMYDMRRTLSLYQVTGTSVSVGEPIVYGVSIADLRDAFGSGHIDLLALYTADGTASEANADEAFILTNGTDDRKFAFMLADSDGQNCVPLPTGWSVKSSPSGYKKGDLIKGRTPKWQLWADNLNLGKYVHSQTEGSYLKYNVFHQPLMDANDGTEARIPHLEDFEGYNNSVKDAKRPTFTLSGSQVNFEYHNGVFNFCDLDSFVPEYDGTTNTPNDDRSIFFASIGKMAKARMAIGNMGNWSTPRTSLPALEQHHGMSATIYCTLPSRLPQPVASAWAVTSQERTSGHLMPFCAESNADTIAQFRDGKVGSEDKWYDMEYVASGTLANELFEALRTATSHRLDAKGQIDLVSRETPSTDAPTGSAIISTEKILAQTTIPVVGSFDASLRESSTSYRCILKTTKVGNDYIYPVWTGNSKGQRHNTRAYGGFCFLFCLWSQDITQSGGSIVLGTGKSLTMSVKFTKNVDGTLTSTTKSVSVPLYTTDSGVGTMPMVYTKFPNGVEEITQGEVGNVFQTRLFVPVIPASQLEGYVDGNGILLNNVTAEVSITANS